MYKYIFTHTFDLKFVKDVSAELQQKWYWYDNDEDIKKVKNTAVTSTGDLSLQRAEIL